jgi:hypothetical protein
MGAGSVREIDQEHCLLAHGVTVENQFMEIEAAGCIRRPHSIRTTGPPVRRGRAQ